MPQGPDSLAFGPFRLDPAGGQLWRGDEVVVLRPKAWQVLRHLVQRPGRLVTIAELLDAAWDGAAVSPNVLTNVIGELRRALDDDPQTPRFIQTVHRRGYRFVAGDAAARSVPEPGGRLFVGRAAELHALTATWQEALAGRRGLVFLAGEPGIGKTTLVDAFVARLASDPSITVARAHCVDREGAGEPYMPVLEILEGLARDGGADTIVELLRGHAPTYLAQIASLLPAAEMQAVRALLGTGAERMLREGVALLEALAARRPLLVVLEDVHWSDRPTLDLVAALARRTAAARLMCVLTYRPVDAVARDHPVGAVARALRLHRHATLLALAPFTTAEVRTYLERRLAGSAVVGALAGLTEEHAAGNPLFVDALVTHLIDRGWLRDENGGWRLTVDPAAHQMEWPEDLRGAIEAQLATLPPAVREVLEAASVEGAEFSVACTAAGLERPTEEVEDLLHEVAVRWDLVSRAAAADDRDGARYRFKHALYRRGAYAGIPPARRRRLHQRIGESLEAVVGDRAGEVASQLVEHFEASDDVERRARYRALAGMTAAARFVPRDAAAHFAEAIAQLRRLPGTPERSSQVAQLELAWGNAVGQADGFVDPRVREAFVRAEVAARAAGAHRERFRALFGICTTLTEVGDVEPVGAVVDELLAMAESVTPFLTAQAHWRAGDLCYTRGDFVAARRHLDISLSSEGEPDIPTLVDWRSAADAQLAATLTQLGFLDQARRAIERAAHRSEGLDRPFVRCQVALTATIVCALQRDEAGMAAWAARTAALAEQYAMEAYRTVALWMAPADVDERVRRLASYRAMMSRWYDGNVLTWLAAGSLSAGDLEGARTWLAQAADLVERLGQRWCEAELWRLRGECTLLERPGDRDGRAEAEASFRRAIDVARGQQARLPELRATTCLARLLDDSGARAEAHALLAASYAGFTEGFDATDLREARALIERLGGTSPVGT